VYGLDTSLTSNDLCGFISNPMEHGEASKLALYGVADYAWNISQYNPIDNWERGMEELIPGAKEAYRTFAIHSCDTETGYRRDESWETKTFTLANWDDQKANALEREYEKMERVPAEMEKGCTNDKLLNELRPWLTEFGKLGTRGKNAVRLARVYRSGVKDNARFWADYVQNMMSDEDQKAFDEHKSGSMKMQPFYENTMDEMAHGFMQSVLHATPKDYRGIGSFANSSTTQAKLMLDNDTVSYYTSGVSQRKDSWIGLDLRAVRDVKEVNILQGRNSVDDVDYFDHATLECSVDGKNWTSLIPEMTKQYVINWKGDAVKARYVRLRRLDSKRTNYASVRSFEVNPLHVETLDFELQVSGDSQKALSIFDQNAVTAYKNNGNVTFGVPAGTKEYTFMMGNMVSPLTCKMLNAKGKTVKEFTINAPFTTVTLPKEEVCKVSLDGKADIYEIVAQ